MARENQHFTNEADIGSGEKNAGQREVERDIASLNRDAPPQDGRQLQNVAEEQRYADMPPQRDGRNIENEDAFGEAHEESRVIREGTHVARMTATRLDDGTYEAQVYVRLTREPAVAETYIPAGVFASEGEAWQAAEERARRALTQREF